MDACVPVDSDHLIERNKRLIRVFESSEGERILVDDKLLRKYWKFDECTFVGKDGTTPVYVFEGGLLTGMIMPVL